MSLGICAIISRGCSWTNMESSISLKEEKVSDRHITKDGFEYDVKKQNV